jgi:hypothetical protein
MRNIFFLPPKFFQPILKNLPTNIFRHGSLSHVSEKCHWLNVFMNRYFLDIQNSQVFTNKCRDILVRKFSRIKKPDFIASPISDIHSNF